MKRPLTKAFDPSTECVALPQQKRKKAFKTKPSNIQLVMVLDPSSGVPKGKSRKILEKQERVRKVEFRREMSFYEVQNCIFQGFSHLQNLVGFTFLEADQGGKLHPSKNQEPDGEYMIVDARRRCGPIYLHPNLVSKCFGVQSVAVGEFWWGVHLKNSLDCVAYCSSVG